MKYLYYSIYWFYERKIKVYKYDTPHFYSTVLLALITNFFIFSIFKLYLLSTVETKINYSKYLFFVSGLIIYYFFNLYFKEKSQKILKEMLAYSDNKRFVIRLVSLIIIVSCIVLFFHTGDLIRNHNTPYFD